MRRSERKHKKCILCGEPIYHEDDTHEQDICYEIDEDTICEDCIMDYCNTFKRKELKADEA